MDGGLIIRKPRGLFAKVPRVDWYVEGLTWFGLNPIRWIGIQRPGSAAAARRLSWWLAARLGSGLVTRFGGSTALAARAGGAARRWRAICGGGSPELTGIGAPGLVSGRGTPGRDRERRRDR